MPNKVKKTDLPENNLTTEAKFFGYAFLVLILLILSALTVKLILWILGIEF